jgi:hypothetical protein
MATHVFKFVVSDVDLTPEQQERISRAVSQAGILAVGDLTPGESITFHPGRGGYPVSWLGLPPIDVRHALETYVSEQVKSGE